MEEEKKPRKKKTPNKVFPVEIQKLRVRAGLSVEDFAASLGVTTSAVKMWERSTVPREEILRKIATTYNISIDTLLGVSIDKSNNIFDITEEVTNGPRKHKTIDFFDDILKECSYNIFMTSVIKNQRSKLNTPDIIDRMKIIVRQFRKKYELDFDFPTRYLIKEIANGIKIVFPSYNDEHISLDTIAIECLNQLWIDEYNKHYL